MLGASSAGITASLRTLQNSAILARSLSGSGCSQRQSEDLGLDAEAGQFAHGVLGRLGLQLAGGGDIGHQRDVDRDAQRRPARRAELVPELADRLDERQRFDVADRAADLAEDEIAVVLDSAREKSLIASVTCGITWTVAPR